MPTRSLPPPNNSSKTDLLILVDLQIDLQLDELTRGDQPGALIPGDVDCLPDLSPQEPSDNYSSNHGSNPRNLKNERTNPTASNKVMNTTPHAKLDNP
jgi:hypothetical protein